MKRFVLLLALLVLASCAKQPPIGPLGGVHYHASVKVFIEGSEVDFAKREYMVKVPYVHIENMNGEVVHVHATGVTVGEYFRTLGMKFTNECFKLPGNKYCTDEQNTLKFYVNGEPNEFFGDYLLGDQDRLLISYGVEEDVQEQMSSIRNLQS